MQTNNKAFTLIELLVVVLIIGILAAVALPQYQVAVAKSRLAAVMPTVKAMKQAAEVYFLANGEYVDDVFAYDVEYPDCDPRYSTGCFTSKNIIFEVRTGSGFCYPLAAGATDVGVILLDNNGKPINSYAICLDQSATPNLAYCGAETDNIVANKVCKTMGGSSPRTGWCDANTQVPCNLYPLS